MKKLALKYGLMSGGIAVALMWATLPFIYSIGLDYGLYIGYSSMLLSFLLVFFGVRAYRENVLGGYIGFFRAVGFGFLIYLIAVLCYVVSWEIMYFTLLPDFGDKYSAYVLEGMRRSGESATNIAAKEEEMKSMIALLNNPFWNGLFTSLEPLPVGVPVTLISALILKKKPKPQTEDPLVLIPESRVQP